MPRPTARRTRVRSFLLVAALASTTGLTACDRTSDPSTVDLPEPTPTTSASRSHSTAAVEVAVRYADGQVSPKGLVAKVMQGQRVQLVVTADVSDEVHVHGYDIKQDIINGRAVIDFLADIPGSFEVELEGKGYQLLTLQVS